jgi:2-polyprenyl-3-methyl-5-hydroxy-6-metoxy-1,4-benzoquinol methylase
MLCQICKNKSMLVCENHPSYIRDKFYSIYFCKHCNTAFVNSIANDATIYDKIYSEAQNIDGYRRYYDYADKIKKKRNPLKYLMSKDSIYDSVINCINQINDKKINILEVGCGFGYLTYALIKCGYNAKGIDVSKTAITDAIKRFGEHYYNVDVEKYARTTTERYDIIVATEVIEHVPDVISFLTSLKSLLKHSGKIILTTPNKSAFSSDALWVTDAPPVHLWWFSEQSMIIIGQKIGMSIKYYDVMLCKNPSYYYYKKNIDLSNPVFVPKFDNTIIVKNRRKINISNINDQFIKLIKNVSKIIGLYPIIKRAGMVKLNMSGMTRSKKPDILCVQLFR